MRIALALAGLHRVDRGAEIAFVEIARALVRAGHEVTLFGSGQERPSEPYRFIHVPILPRRRFERWPSLPLLRGDTGWEEASFAPGLLAKFRPADFDIAATCAYPFTQFALRRPAVGGRKPKNVFITENGDWPAYSDSWEFRFFSCDGLVCTNPDFAARNQNRFRCALIPNGVNLERFAPGPGDRQRFGLPDGRLILMASALIGSKNVADGIIAMAKVPDATLVVAGDGPHREQIDQLAAEMLPGRFKRLTVPAPEMPLLYRSADVFMHLAVDESFGNVFVEAMATDLPIVAYDTPRTRWIVGERAYYARERNADALAKAINQALAGDRNAGAVRRRAQAFGWDLIADQYASFFKQLISDDAVVTKSWAEK